MKRSAGGSHQVIVAHGALTVAVAAISLLYVITGIDAASLIYPASAVLAAMIGWCLWSWQGCGGSLGDPYCLFLFAAIAFNASHIILLALNV
jgi:hypothetical protein